MFFKWRMRWYFAFVLVLNFKVVMWTCSVDFYGNGTACDCLCGTDDYDCQNSSLPIPACDSGEICMNANCAGIISQ